MAQEGRVQPICLRLTGRPPELSLAERQRFHLFLSRRPQPRRRAHRVTHGPGIVADAGDRCRRIVQTKPPICFNVCLVGASRPLHCRCVVDWPGFGRYNVNGANIEPIRI
eukprot:7379608-Prymnesium_polylepis.3